MFAIRFKGGKIYQSTISHEHCFTVAEIEGEKLPRKCATLGMMGMNGEFRELDQGIANAIIDREKRALHPMMMAQFNKGPEEQRDFNERMSFGLKKPEEKKPGKKRPSLLRKLLGLPFVIIGASSLMLAELIAGDKITFRGREFADEIESPTLKEANSLLRSAYSIAQRRGAITNWEAFEKNVKALLDKMHKDGIIGI